MSGSRWCFHIDTSIDDGAAGTSGIDHLVKGSASLKSSAYGFMGLLNP